MKLAGIAFLVLGLLAGLFGLNFDTTVSTGIGRVHNIGLLEERGILFGAAGLCLVLGTLFLGFAALARSRQPTFPPHDGSSPASVPLSQLINRFRVSGSLSVDELEQLADRASRESRLANLVCSASGETLLHLAARRGNVAAVQKLLDAGASRSTKDLAGRLPSLVTDSDAVRRLLGVTPKE